MFNIFKKELTVAQLAELLRLFSYELQKKMRGHLDDLMRIYSKEIPELTKSVCDIELYYLINAIIYIMLSKNLDLKCNNDELDKLLTYFHMECSNVLHQGCSEERGDYGVSQFDWRIQAYKLAWASKELNPLTGIRSIFQSAISVIIKTNHWDAADDKVIDYVNDQESINNEMQQIALKLPGVIAGPICASIISVIGKFLNELPRNYKVMID